MKKKVDKFHRHEVTDRCSMVCEIIEYQLLGHPAITLMMAEELVKAQVIISKIGSVAAQDHCKKCGRTALTKSIIKKNKKVMVCLCCFNAQKRETLNG